MVALVEQPPAVQKKTRIVFIDIGRGLGALLVFYSHIAHPWVIAKNDSAPYISFIEALTSNPMHMSTQGIGEIAVPFFFVVSGFVVTPIALRQGQRRFAVNRLIRVYAPMLFVVLLTALMLVVSLHPPSTGQSQELNPLTIFTNTFLVNYLIYPQVVLVPVAWSMIVEVVFYVVLMAVLPLLRRSVWLAIAVELTFIFVVMMSRSQLGPSWSLFAVNVSYLPVMIIGQTIWATTAKKIPLWTGALYGACAWSLYVLADIIDVGRVDTSYNLSMAFAVLLFMLGMMAEPKLKQRKFWTAVSERSYSIYLLHMLVSFVLLQLLRPAVPLPIALLIVIPAVFGVVEVCYRWVERPSHALARKLSYRREKPVPIKVNSEITIEIPKVGERPRHAAGSAKGSVSGSLNGNLPSTPPKGTPKPPPPKTPPGPKPPPPPADAEKTVITRAVPPRRPQPQPQPQPRPPLAQETGSDRTAEPRARHSTPRRRPSAPLELQHQSDQEDHGQRGDHDDLPRHGSSFRRTHR
ncbi:acyltransferase [Amycolatopsis sp. DSM 110486]|uniref:acyltransferase family protein n=1 Tax=Amycolatopsis sp. DSM 110486 TaxID=2865832 RepID=UPI001C6977BB|nr:acyltransferase [Amycolatopsis sp. DSM 110486]QYN24285.1 acyltransferase [Amycolatopsis sp. DSM 110486]